MTQPATEKTSRNQQKTANTGTTLQKPSARSPNVVTLHYRNEENALRMAIFRRADGKGPSTARPTGIDRTTKPRRPYVATESESMGSNLSCQVILYYRQMKKETAKWLIQILISILTAIATALGTTSCMNHL